ncbi:MAG: hypothetical protein AVDCRST_MAG77-1475 [uncultured Chloroflexi bacterium]|uniref:Uncharacterized protein n=1 Tax=uncultured Chloroflexota bacterium TaxID=166587 RepID=A0A6J4HWR9_9CHLR|nr:MAG: hypothetical protein AVDCRST_MAG77-1475 [uncultured Chloroflexota bacterium]
MIGAATGGTRAATPFLHHTRRPESYWGRLNGNSTAGP